MIGIYKIENKVNGKIYIGQSIHIERRFQEHCRDSSTSLISKAIKKYGKDNFSFEIIEECSIEELNKLEEYYIRSYNSVVPHGYNIAEPNNNDVYLYTWMDKDKVCHVIDDILNTDMSFNEIAKKYNISYRAVYYINSGETHRFEEYTYPLRDVSALPAKKFYCIDCGKELYYGSVRCMKCFNLYKERSHYIESGYPEYNKLKYLIKNKSFEEIGRMYGVSGNAVKQWCKKLGLPHQKYVINSIPENYWAIV